jgi:hypothetical protein
MRVKVHFPDDSVREVPSRKVELPSKEVNARSSAWTEEPLFDPEWEFHPVAGGNWYASPRRKR